MLRAVRLLCIGQFLLMACGPKPTPDPVEETSNAKPVVTVAVEALTTGPIGAYVELPTTLETEQLLTVVAEARGLVEALLVDDQDPVQEGEVLARIDFRQRQLTYEKSIIEHKDAERTLQRQKKLALQNLNTQSDVDAAQIAFDRTAIAKKEAKIELDKASVHAPFDGIIAQRHIRKGQFVSEGTDMFVVVDPTKMRAVVSVPEKDIVRLRQDQEATFTFDALPGETFAGKVDVIAPIIDKDSGTLRVRIGLNTVDERLRVGLFARVRIVTQTIEEAVLLPKNALVYEGGTPHIFIAETKDRGDGKVLARKRRVTLGLQTAAHAQVVSGARQGERVVVKGQNSLKADQEIRVAE